MRVTLAITYILLTASSVCSHVVLSEIMYNPEETERYNEFVEVFNLSETESVDLTGWMITDGSASDVLQPVTDSAILPPRTFGLILSPKYFKESQLYDNDIPASAVLLTIGNVQIGAYGLKNSEGETVSILRPDSTVLSSRTYTPDNDDGFSEEKIVLDEDDSPDNWANSARKGGTPGYRNSISPVPVDAAISGFTIQPETPSDRDKIKMMLTILNMGTNAIETLACTITDSSQHTRTLIDTTFSLLSLSPADSAFVSFEHPPLSVGRHKLSAVVRLSGDARAENDTRICRFSVLDYIKPGSVVINEVMYNTEENDQEWIELFNLSQEKRNLKNWQICDSRSTKVIDSTFVLPPNAYAVLAGKDLPHCDRSKVLHISLPALNNGGDDIVLLSPVGDAIDSLHYKSDYGGDKMISLERIRTDKPTNDPTNWSSSTDSAGSTPGRYNSVSPKDFDVGFLPDQWRITPNKPQQGQSIHFFGAVKNVGRNDLDAFDISIKAMSLDSSEHIEIDRKELASLMQGEARHFDVIWHSVSAGVYLINAEIHFSLDGDIKNNVLTDTACISYDYNSLVINEIYYQPAKDLSEAIELVNHSESKIELYQWKLSDSDSSEKLVISDSSLTFHAGQFAILAPVDSLFDTADVLCPVSGFPSLRNTADTLFLYDFNNRRVDEVGYSDNWGGAKGRSLERINPDIASDERTNWATCVHPDGHTLGRQNSVHVTKKHAQAVLSVSPNPFSPDGDGIDDVTMVTLKLPEVVPRATIKIFDIRGRLVRYLLNNELCGEERTVVWDGRDNEGLRCRMGIYIVYVETINVSDTTIEETKTTVVLAGHL